MKRLKNLWLCLAAVLLLPLSMSFVGCSPKAVGLVCDASATKLEYVVGETVDPFGLEVSLKFDDGTVAKVPEYTINLDGVDNQTPGKYDVVVQYKSYTAKYKVEYFAKGTVQLVGDTKFHVGQVFETANPDVLYTSGKGTQTHIVDYSISSFDNDEANAEAEVVLRYQGSDYTFTVEVLGTKEYCTWLIAKTAETKDLVTTRLDNLAIIQGDELSFFSGNGGYFRYAGEQIWTETDAFSYHLLENGDYYRLEHQDIQTAMTDVSHVDVDLPITADVYKSLYEELHAELGKFTEEGDATFENNYTIITITITGVDAQGQTNEVGIVIDLRYNTLVGWSLKEGDGVRTQYLYNIERADYDIPDRDTSMVWPDNTVR